MSRRFGRLVVATLLALCAPRLLPAQRAVSSEARAQEHVVDTLVARWREVAKALGEFDDSLARIRAVTDTLRVGNLRLLVEPAIRSRAESAARVANARIDSIAGSAARRLEDRWLAVHYLSDVGHDTVVVAIRGRLRQEYATVWGPASDSALAEWIFQDARVALSNTIDRQMYFWMATTPTPDTLPTAMWLNARLNIVSSETSIARRCYDGDIEACKISLRLIGYEDPVMTWFDAAARRRYVTRHGAYSGGSGSVGGEACVAGSDAACVNVMHAINHFADPIPPYLRNTVAAVAVQMGGHAGFERMLNGTDAPMQRLASVAGVPVDSVLRTWLSKVHGTRLPSQDMTPGIALSSLGWVLVCGLLAIRSSRWR